MAPNRRPWIATTRPRSPCTASGWTHRCGGPRAPGPSDDGHVLVDGANAALPINPAAPTGARRALVRTGPDGGVTDLGVEVATVARPAFYDLTTADGVPYEQIARLHGDDVLATTVVQTCIRYGEQDRCRFCTIEESLRTGATIAAKTPDPARRGRRGRGPARRRAADGDDHRHHATAATAAPGTWSAASGRSGRRCRACRSRCRASRPRRRTWRCCRSCATPAPTAIGIHVESLDDDVRARWMPGKATVPLAEYEAAWDEAVRVFGATGSRRTCWSASARTPTSWSRAPAELIDRGVYPFVVPFRPMPGTLAAADGDPAPDPELLARRHRAGRRGPAWPPACAAPTRAPAAPRAARAALSAAGGLRSVSILDRPRVRTERRRRASSAAGPAAVPATSPSPRRRRSTPADPDVVAYRALRHAVFVDEQGLFLTTRPRPRRARRRPAHDRAGRPRRRRRRCSAGCGSARSTDRRPRHRLVDGRPSRRRPAARRRAGCGVGAALVRAACARAEAAGVLRFEATVQAAQRAAVRAARLAAAPATRRSRAARTC